MSGNSFLRLGRGRRWSPSDLVKVVTVGGLRIVEARPVSERAPVLIPKIDPSPGVFCGFSFTLPWAPSVNGAYSNVKKGRVKTKGVRKFEALAWKSLEEQFVPRNRISHPMAITIRQHAAGSRGDPDNGIKCALDVLKKFGVIADDNRGIVKEIHVYDCEHSDPPFIEINIAAVLPRN